MTVEVTFLPDNKKIKVRPGTTLLDAGRRAGSHIRTRCGGKTACLMCKVRIADQSGLSQPAVNEKNKLGSLIDDGIRLACQAKAVGDVTVYLPEDPLKAAIRKQLERQENDRDDG